MKEVSHNRNFVSVAAALTLGGSAFVGACAAPEGTHSIGRVVSHEIVTTTGTKLRQFPNNRARFPLVDKKDVTSYLITVRNCGTMTPPPEVEKPGCKDTVINNEALYNQFADGALVEFNRDRIIGEFVVPHTIET